MITALEEVSEADAEGKVKSTYDDIKATLRTPLVNLVFRVLATHPDYLLAGWSALKPNAQTMYFEQRADELRRLAVEGMGELGRPQTSPGFTQAVDVLRVFHYINPKLLLCVAALRMATNGQQPRVMLLSRDEKRQVAPGVPPEAPTIAMIDPDQADPGLRRVLNDIKATLGLPVLNSDYRALAQWPEYLAGAWHALKPLVVLPEYQRLMQVLRRSAEESVLALPYRMDLSPHVLRQSGLSERQIDEVRATLDAFNRLIPGLIANIAFLAAGAEGKPRAALSPFPARAL